MTWDETDGWIFSDEAHDWMDDLPSRRKEALGLTDWQNFSYRVGHGKEYGLFGFKPHDKAGPSWRWYPTRREMSL